MSPSGYEPDHLYTSYEIIESPESGEDVPVVISWWHHPDPASTQARAGAAEYRQFIRATRMHEHMAYYLTERPGGERTYLSLVGTRGRMRHHPLELALAEGAELSVPDPFPHGLGHVLVHADMPANSAARVRRVAALDGHGADEVTVHDAPLVQVVYEVLEMAAEEEDMVSPDLLRAAADVLDRLVGHHNHICNSAIYGVRAGGWLADTRMWERIYTTTAPAAVLAAAALRTMRDAARIPDEDEATDADCMFNLEEAARFARTAADLAVHPAA